MDGGLSASRVVQATERWDHGNLEDCLVSPSMSLAFEELGDRDGPRLVLVHGFAQNRNCWGVLVDQLAADHRLILVDAPGHGESHYDEADLEVAAELLVEIGGTATYVGYSMGGRVVLRAALAAPDAVSRMVLISSTAGIEDAAERAARRVLDEARAVDLEQRGLAAFLDDWLALPLFSTLGAAGHHRAERETNRVEGLAASLRNCGTGVQSALWSRLGEVRAATTVVVGEHDAKFTAIGERMSMELTAELAVVPSVGHAAHLEAPSLVADVISRAVVDPR